MPKPAAYLRVSSADQRERETILTQEQELRKYFELQGLDPDTDVLWYRDDGVSGKTSMVSRGNSAKLLQDVEVGAIRDYVAVFSISRLSRDTPDYFNFAQLIDELGVSIRSVSEGIDTRQGSGDFMAGLMALVAAKSHRDLMVASKAGHERAAREGRWQGEPPYGYRVGESSRLEIIKEQAEVVREIFRLYVEERMGSSVIVNHLNDRGVPGPRGGKWYGTSLLRLLRNTVYVGRAYYNTTKTMRRRGKFEGYQPRDVTEHIEVSAPPILSDALFAEAQALLQSRCIHYAPTGATKTQFALPQVRCGECNSRFWGEFKRKRRKDGLWRHYRHDHRSGRKACPSFCFPPAELLEEVVWTRVMRAIRSPELWQEELARESSAEDGESAFERELAEIKAQLGETQSALARLEDAYIIRGTLAPDRYEALAKEIQAKVARLGQRQAELRARRDQVGQRNERSQVLAERMRQLQEVAETATIGEKREVIGELINRVLLVKRNDEIELTIEWRV